MSPPLWLNHCLYLNETTLFVMAIMIILPWNDLAVVMFTADYCLSSRYLPLKHSFCKFSIFLKKVQFNQNDY